MHARAPLKYSLILRVRCGGVIILYPYNPELFYRTWREGVRTDRFIRSSLASCLSVCDLFMNYKLCSGATSDENDLLCKRFSSKKGTNIRVFIFTHIYTLFTYILLIYNFCISFYVLVLGFRQILRRINYCKSFLYIINGIEQNILINNRNTTIII